MATVLETVVDVYRKLLLSSKQSDIQFLFSDGQILTAHKAILATASLYFATAFEGPWAENDGEWNTSYPSPIIEAVLTFIYTGNVDVIRERPMEMLSIAGEFDIAPLKEIATVHCIESLTVGNFAAMLQLTHLHDIQNLKVA